MSLSLGLKPLTVCTPKCQKDKSSKKSKLPMVQCVLCDRWHHFECVGYPAGTTTSVRGLYLCPNCVENLKEKERRLAVLEDTVANFHAEFALLRGMWERSMTPAAPPMILGAAYVSLMQENAELKLKMQAIGDFKAEPKASAKTPKSETDSSSSSEEEEETTDDDNDNDDTASNSACLRRKRRAESGTGPYKCKLCGQRYSSLQSVYRHTKKQHPGSLFQCNVCTLQFSLRSNYERHMLKHSQAKGGETNGDRYRRQYLISRRWTEKKAEEESSGPVRCDACGQMFLQRKALLEHVRVKHSEVESKSFPETSDQTCCKESAQESANRTDDALSGRLIPKQEPMDNADNVEFSADAVTTSSTNLVPEGESSSKRGLYVCKDCGTSYRASSKLDVHRFKQHNGPSPYLCRHCDKTFNSEKGLSFHLNHHDLETFACLLCNVNFIMKPHLSLHEAFHRASDESSKAKACKKLNHKHFNKKIWPLSNSLKEAGGAQPSSALKDSATSDPGTASAHNFGTPPKGTSGVTDGGDDRHFPNHTVTRSASNDDKNIEGDNYFHCSECDESYLGECPRHPMQRVHDTELEPDDGNRAYNSLPAGLSIAKSNIVGAGLGVFADVAISKDLVFGPYVGRVTYDVGETVKSDYCWQVLQTLSPSYYIDGRDIAHSNWLRFVNCAENDEQQNLTAIQYKGEIFYRALKALKPGDELLVWYGEEYAKVLGLTEKGGATEDSSDEDKDTSEREQSSERIGATTTFASRAAEDDCEERKTRKKMVWKKTPVRNVVVADAAKIAKTRDSEGEAEDGSGSLVTGKRGVDDCVSGDESLDLGKRARCSPESEDDERGSRCSSVAENSACSSVCGKESRCPAYFSCRTCSKRFSKLSDVRLHARTHQQRKALNRHRCPNCSMRFNSEDRLAEHIKREHELVDSSEEDFELEVAPEKAARSRKVIYTSDEDETANATLTDQKVEEETDGDSIQRPSVDTEGANFGGTERCSADGATCESASEADVDGPATTATPKRARESSALFSDEESEEDNSNTNVLLADCFQHLGGVDEPRDDDVKGVTVTCNRVEEQTEKRAISSSDVALALNNGNDVMFEDDDEDDRTDANVDSDRVTLTNGIAKGSVSSAGVGNADARPCTDRLSEFEKLCSVASTSAIGACPATSSNETPASLSEIVAMPISSLSLERLLDRMMTDEG